MLWIRPVLEWERVTLRMDLKALEHALNRLLGDGGVLRELRLQGDGDAVEVTAQVVWKGLPGSISARLRELRLKHRYVGCRVESLHGPLGVRLPLAIMAPLIDKMSKEVVRFDPSDGIILIDLRAVIPSSLHLRITDITCRDGKLELHLGPGGVDATLPGLAPLLEDPPEPAPTGGIV